MEREYNLQNRDLVASIYEMYYTDLKQYFVSYTRDVMAAEDMLQDLFVKVMNLDVIAHDTAKNLLFVMAKRMIIDDARHKAFVRETEKQMQLSMGSMDNNSVVRRIEAADILLLESKHLAEMAPKRAHIYKMYKHEGCTADEIAEQLNLSKRTVESHIYLSTKDMKAYLRKII
nr:sigma-70 family RNA polymerase sigma factor [uncultured Prevotella sp.]